MSSVPPPNNSDILRAPVDSSIEQPGGGTEGTVDHLNEARQAVSKHLNSEGLPMSYRETVEFLRDKNEATQIRLHELWHLVSRCVRPGWFA